MTPKEIIQYNMRNSVEVSQGLGDTVAKVAHAVGADKVADLYTKITGKDCGCEARREALNKLVSYSKGE